MCITSLGVVGTALDSSVTTDPADEIDLNYDQLPIGTGDAAAIQEEIDRGDDEETEATEQLEIDPGGDEETGATEQLQQAESTGTGTSPPTLLSRLLALLGAIVRVLLVFGAITALAAVVYHYRERLLAIFATVATADGETSQPITSADTWPGTEPSNPVDRAWLWMIRRANTERPATKTPAECATIAREAGIDPAAVDVITDAFERVHYGGVPVEREADRARAALERLRNDDRQQSDSGRNRHYGGED